MKIVGVIPARSGSKSVINKNLRLVGGEPLITYMIKTALRVTGISELVVSTDSQEIADVAMQSGVKVPCLRPAELAGDEVPLVAVSKHILDYYDQHFFKPDAIISLQPTSPLLSMTSINKAIELFQRGKFDSVVSVTQIRHFHPFRAYQLNGAAVMPLTEYTSERFLQKQDRPPAYGFTGGVYLRGRALLKAWEGEGFGLGLRVGGVVVPEEEAIDIDSELDLMLFEAVLRHRDKRD